MSTQQTIWLKGIALLSALTSLQQWMFHNISLFDIFFLVLVVAFLITLERDYLSYVSKIDKDKELSGEQQKTPNDKYFFLKQLFFVNPTI